MYWYTDYMSLTSKDIQALQQAFQPEFDRIDLRFNEIDLRFDEMRDVLHGKEVIKSVRLINKQKRLIAKLEYIFGRKMPEPICYS